MIENKMIEETRLFRCERKLAPMEVENARLDGRFSGYASLFGKVDRGRDAVMPGAFGASLAARAPGSVRMLFQHDPDQPIGVWQKIVEDDHGLYVEGRITTAVSRGAEILELLRSGAVDGLSVGFKTKRARTDPATGVRKILEADLWEISVVTFPLLEGARIDAVKSDRCGMPTKREFEQWLTRDAGLSRRDARRLIAGGYGALACKQDAAGVEPRNLAEMIRRATKLIQSRS